ncbi:MAG: non-canonical purine NTP pyrophosphatase, RdgB/HAM1 family, dITP/XTP pyrophosphatase [Candidatus Peregrinibacteria bacterium GW2011_GWE2_39_6]|nr:MAG: non-canonical purine NTP pyrophosphatase, RdgB/HAM1 family, dITP/XTP pyrophosphatase [Candidatus Peregrinibacteria bacterium GW2011_GWF2_39_17]KKR25171.1 MAG: non-canonical purine NTP pyrophosphatase, RdgB/HAM1 family, dITP/XTP pyrophosphatase [Candidatus Peregrinibacteria bacterium GW2011_GWE2_39_6]HCW32218.1 non-canonical purine NTP pyrophosphatase [Candidatus Peregrinibacteria bacterium]
MNSLASSLLVATANLGKLAEIKAILRGLNCEILSLKDVPQGKDQVEESGLTHEENALLKARYFYYATGLMTLAEDSGIEVEALQGELGLYTRRWGAGEQASDQEWLTYFLKRMADVADLERGAKFVCSAALILPNGTEHVFNGVSFGCITKKAEAELLAGLPLSSVFRPNGFDRVYAALTKKEKGEVSHRGLAIGQVRDFLHKYLLAQ